MIRMSVFVRQEDAKALVDAKDESAKKAAFKIMIANASVNNSTDRISLFLDDLRGGPESSTPSRTSPSASPSASPSTPSSTSPSAGPLVKVTCPHLPDPNFFEPQESLGCGRHALNNLLGGRYFIKSSLLPITNDNIKYLPLPIPLINLCNFLINTKKITHSVSLGGDACPSDENYDDAVLTSALQIIGFKTYLVLDLTDPKTTASINTLNSTKDFIGFILNLGGGHWISFRNIGSNEYRRIDSIGDIQLKALSIKLDAILEEARKYERYALIAVVCKGKFIDTYFTSDALIV
jgi:hypothetical protein